MIVSLYHKNKVFMKTIENFLRQYPSYTKWGTSRLAKRVNLAESTVNRFKKTEKFRSIKMDYLKGL